VVMFLARKYLCIRGCTSLAFASVGSHCTRMRCSLPLFLSRFLIGSSFYAVTTRKVQDHETQLQHVRAEVSQHAAMQGTVLFLRFALLQSTLSSNQPSDPLGSKARWSVWVFRFRSRSAFCDSRLLLGSKPSIRGIQ
jgi:hypothetical protein